MVSESELFFKSKANLLRMQMIKLKKALRKSENTFYELANASVFAVYILQDDCLCFINSTLKSITGYSRKETKNFFDLIHPDLIEMIKKRLIVRQNGDDIPCHYELKYITKNGQERWGINYTNIIKYCGQSAIIGIIYDITDFKLLQKELDESRHRLSDIINFFPEATFVIDENGNVIAWNKAMEKMTGIKAQDILGKGDYEYSIPFYGTRRPLLIDIVIEENEVIEGPCHNREGKEIIIRATSSPIYDLNGNKVGAIESIRDITKNRISEEKIKYLSFYDKLTSLYNRAFFEDQLDIFDKSHNLPLSLILGDLNGLKLVNDALGHHKGDILLQKAAEIIRKSCRSNDIVARWGGDEFIVLLPLTDKENAIKVCQRIKNACTNNEGFYIPISIALGTATKNNPLQDIHDVLTEAEDDMYRNKLLESKNTRNMFINSLKNTLKINHKSTEEHIMRLSKIATDLGRNINLPNIDLTNLKLLATLHDIGKITIPKEIIDKAESLSPEEWEAIKKHPETGYRIALSTPELAPIAEAILAHHERWDGSGYPLGLKGREIPLLSRILAIVDAYEAMTSGRPYQQAIDKQAALAEISRCAGTQFDPELAQMFIKMMTGSKTIQFDVG